MAYPKEEQKHLDAFDAKKQYVVQGSLLRTAVRIMHIFYREEGLNGDEMRDFAQVLYHHLVRGDIAVL